MTVNFFGGCAIFPSTSSITINGITANSPVTFGNALGITSQFAHGHRRRLRRREPASSKDFPCGTFNIALGDAELNDTNVTNAGTFEETGGTANLYNSYWYGVGFGSTGNLNVLTGTMSIGATYMEFAGTIWVNNGALTLQADSIDILAATTISDGDGGILNLDGPWTFENGGSLGGGGSQFINLGGDGTITNATYGGAELFAIAGTMDLDGHSITSDVGMTLDGGTITNSDTSDASTINSAIALTGDSSIDAAGPLVLTTPMDLAGYTLSGTGAISLDGGTIINSDTDTASTISAGITLLADTTLDTGGDVYFAGTLDLNGHTLDSAAPLLFGGTIANSDTSDAGTLASDVTLAADATINTAGLVYATGTFDLNGHTLSGSTPLALDGGILANSDTDDTGTISTDIWVVADSYINTDGDMALSGVLSGAANLYKSGAGTLTLTGTSTLSSTIDVAAGTLANNGSLADATVNIEDAGAYTGTGAISASPGGSLLSLGGYATSGEGVLLYWADDGVASRYVVEKWNSDTEAYDTVGSAGMGATGMLVTGLTPENTYLMRVTEYNLMGLQLRNNTLEVETLEDDSDGPGVYSVTSPDVNTTTGLLTVHHEFSTDTITEDDFKIVNSTVVANSKWEAILIAIGGVATNSATGVAYTMLSGAFVYPADNVAYTTQTTNDEWSTPTNVGSVLAFNNHWQTPEEYSIYGYFFSDFIRISAEKVANFNASVVADQASTAHGDDDSPASFRLTRSGDVSSAGTINFHLANDTDGTGYTVSADNNDALSLTTGEYTYAFAEGQSDAEIYLTADDSTWNGTAELTVDSAAHDGGTDVIGSLLANTAAAPATGPATAQAAIVPGGDIFKNAKYFPNSDPKYSGAGGWNYKAAYILDASMADTFNYQTVNINTTVNSGAMKIGEQDRSIIEWGANGSRTDLPNDGPAIAMDSVNIPGGEIAQQIIDAAAFGGADCTVTVNASFAMDFYVDAPLVRINGVVEDAVETDTTTNYWGGQQIDGMVRTLYNQDAGNAAKPSISYNFNRSDPTAKPGTVQYEEIIPQGDSVATVSHVDTYTFGLKWLSNTTGGGSYVPWLLGSSSSIIFTFPGAGNPALKHAMDRTSAP